MDIKGKKITVIGMGESGREASFFLKKQGADVFASDCGNSKEIESAARDLRSSCINVETKRHTKDFIQDCQLLIISPGVPDTSVAVRWAKEQKREIIGEIELAYRFCKGRVIAITGTNGKSTTCTVLAQALKNAGKDAVLCGNVGEAFIGKIDKISKNTIVILEISSFQLENIKTFRPYISVILNISQNHLDRHKDIEDYFAAKKRIYQYQQGADFLVLNYDDESLKNIDGRIKPQKLFFSRNTKVKGGFADKNGLFLNIKSPQLISRIQDLRLRQAHNTENFLAVSICASLCGVSVDIIKKTLANFTGLEHRVQLVATINGVDFVDDSKATTVDATCAALRSIPQRVILIAGGRNKGSDFRLAGEQIKQNVKTLIAIGEARKQLKEQLSSVIEIVEAQDMD